MNSNSNSTSVLPASLQKDYPSLFIALELNYKNLEFPHQYVTFLGDVASMQLYRGTGKTSKAALDAAIRKFKNG